MIEMIGDKFLDVGENILQFMLSPVKFLGHAVTKLFGYTQKVEVVGGTLDTIKHVEQIGGSKIIPTKSNSQHPVPVRIVASDICVPVCNQMNPSATTTPGTAAVDRAAVMKYRIKPTSRGRLGLSDVMAAAMEQHDIQDESQAKDAKVEEGAKEEASKGAAANVIKERTSLREKFTNIKNSIKQTALLQKIAAGTAKFKEGWDAIFSKKGLVTGLLLLGLPLLWKAFRFIADSGGLGRFISEGLGNLTVDIGKGIMDAIKNGFSTILCKLGFSSFCEDGTSVPESRIDVGGESIEDTYTAEHMVTAGLKIGAWGAQKLGALSVKAIQAGKYVKDTAVKAGGLVKKGVTNIKNIIGPKPPPAWKPPTGPLGNEGLTQVNKGTGNAISKEGQAVVKNTQMGKIAQFADEAEKSIIKVVDAIVNGSISNRCS
jgi:hypothetical protein